MARLIDADAVLAELDKFANPMPNKSGYDFLCGIATAITEIEDSPTVDAVEVVRCRDCKHWDSETWFCDNHSTFRHHGLDWNMFSEDDFCSYGERNDGDRNG